MTILVAVQIISIYLFCGLLSNFVGPVSRRIKEEFRKTELQTALYLLAAPEVYEQRKNRILPLKIIFRLLVLLFYPIFFLIVLFDYYREKRHLKNP
jgi:hypothetical protein